MFLSIFIKKGKR